MNKILIAYTTNAGSTEDVAHAIGEELARKGAQVDIRRIEELSAKGGDNVADIGAYDAIVVGAPMIIGWHRNALNFIHTHQREMARKKVAYFFIAMSLTQTVDSEDPSLPVYIDPGLAQPPKKPGRLSLKENYATLKNYLRPVFKAAPSLHPVSLGFFGGKLEIYRLKWWQMLFVILIIQAQPGDLRNWTVIREWARSLY